MRLTMRTLLNWINHNLSEEDAALVAQKVEESELARALKNQIEEVMRQGQLPAPMVLDGTPLGNANSSAEYIDNAMEANQTKDYEKFCLHSDVMLGEVAACHEILSHVLSDWPQVSPELRTRLCGLYQFMDTGSEFSIPLPKTQPKNTVQVQTEDVSTNMFTEMDSEEKAVKPKEGTGTPKVEELKKVEGSATPKTTQKPIVQEAMSDFPVQESSETATQLMLWKCITGVSLALFGGLLLLDKFFPECTPGRILERIFGW